MCRCCIYSSSNGNQFSNATLNDGSTGLLMMDDGCSSLRSMDDLELSESIAKKRFTNCPHNVLSNIDMDTRSIDMGLINRLALDSEINNLIQKNHQFTNQLLYCQNRTSSIYTDSSDDISSLAGSDSLLWDDRSFTSIPPNARSAQIAKIVEYFERKGQTFKPFNVPDYTTTSATTNIAATAATTTPQSVSSKHRFNSSSFTDCFNDYQFTSAAGLHSNRKFIDYNNYKLRSTSSTTTTTVTTSASAANLPAHSINSTIATPTTNDYESFCLELDKRPTQQRLMVCEGAVKSKLQIFDKLNSVKQISSQREQ